MKYEDNLELVRQNLDFFKDSTGHYQKVAELLSQGLSATELRDNFNVTGLAPRTVTRAVWEMAKKVQGSKAQPKPAPAAAPAPQPEPVQTIIQPKKTAQTTNMSRYIPSHNGYIPRTLYGTTDVKLLGEMYQNRDYVLIIGETGSGKTHLVRNLAYNKKIPYMRVNMNGATTPEDLAGQWIPNPDPSSQAKYVWRDGVLTEFMRNGGVFVVDEINMTPAEMLSMFHSVTDDERRLVLTQKDGEVINAHPDFYFVATMNPSSYEGTGRLNSALKDRFRVLYLDYNQTVEKKLKIDEKISEVAENLRKSDAVMTPVSTRDLIQYMQDTEHYGDKVARELFINKFDSEEQKAVKEVIEMIVDGKNQETEEEQTEGEEQSQ